MAQLNREKKICLGVDPFWGHLAMIATQDIALPLFFRRRIILGNQNLPIAGPVILAPTHRSRWDALMLTMAAGRRITHRDCRFMVTVSEMSGLQGWFLNRLGCFPVNQSKPSLMTLRYSIDLMTEAKQLVVFPEGRINPSGEKIQLEQGLVRLAKLAENKGVQIQVVPVGIAYSSLIPKPFSKAALCFSKPLSVSSSANKSALDFNAELASSMHSAEEAALRAVGRK